MSLCCRPIEDKATYGKTTVREVEGQRCRGCSFLLCNLKLRIQAAERPDSTQYTPNKASTPPRICMSEPCSPSHTMPKIVASTGSRYVKAVNCDASRYCSSQK